MPPIAKLTPDQALYQFISGYTSKIAGTEVGLGKEPEITFSACFGGAVHGASPVRSTRTCSRRKIVRHGANCWLVNTGWVGGPYGVGKRISIRYTRALLNAALDGKLMEVEYATDPDLRVRGAEDVRRCPRVGAEPLGRSWSDPKHYMQRYRELAARFIENFKKFEAGCPPEVIAAGPKR